VFFRWQLCFKIDLGQDKLIDTTTLFVFGNYHASSNAQSHGQELILWNKYLPKQVLLTVQKEGVYKAEVACGSFKTHHKIKNTHLR
jgi:hypothetical protein